LRNDLILRLLTPHFFVWFVEWIELIHHHLIPYSYLVSTNMRNEVIPPNLRNEPMIHHHILDEVIPQTKHPLTDWIPDSGATNHTTPHAGNISLFRPPDLTTPSSIIVGNCATLPVSSVGDTVLPGPLYLNNILHTPHIIQNLLFVRRFTTDNCCSMEFDPFGVSVKDLRSKNVIIRSNSVGPLYTLRLPSSSLSTTCALAAISTPTWHRRLGHPGIDVLSQLTSSSVIQCSRSSLDLCHACQLGCHIRLPFSSLSTCTEQPFDIIHCDLWTSPIASVSGYKYYLVILDDFTHYLWTFPLRLKSDTFDALSSFLRMSQRNLVAPLNICSVIMGVNSTTPPLVLFSSLVALFYTCLAPILLPRM
jgi:hypothetical protein